MTSFIEAVLKTKVAQICGHVGYNAITLDSANILVDIYRRTFIHLARHCKEAANNNRRVEPTLVDLIQAYDFVGISINELHEYVQEVRLPFDREILREELRPSNRIQRDLFVDDLLEAKKHNNSGEHDENGENKLTVDDRGSDEELGSEPLLKDVYQDIANQFPSPVTPVKADKLRIKSEEKPAIPRLKITPLDPAVAEPPSFLPLLESSKDDRSIPITIKNSQSAPPLESKKGLKARGRTKIAKTKNKGNTKLKIRTKAKLKAKIKEKELKAKAILAPPAAPTPKTTPQPDEVQEPSASPALVIPTPPPIKPPTPNLEPPPKIRTPAPPEEKLTHAFPSPQPTPKQASKGRKKKKKSDNQFAIVTESVTANAEAEEVEWFCPVCNGPDNGDLMLQCEGRCGLWFHLKCTGLKKEPKEDENWECIDCSKPKTKSSSSNRHSTKGSKKREKVSPKVNIEAKISTPQPPTPTIQKQNTPSPPPQIIQPPVIIDHQVPVTEPEPVRPAAICGSSEDLCPECQLPDDGTLMIQCEDPDCAKWFHGKCVNVLSADDHEIWFCKMCVEKQSFAFKRRRRVK